MGLWSSEAFWTPEPQLGLHCGPAGKYEPKNQSWTSLSAQTAMALPLRLFGSVLEQLSPKAHQEGSTGFFGDHTAPKTPKTPKAPKTPTSPQSPQSEDGFNLKIFESLPSPKEKEIEERPCAAADRPVLLGRSMGLYPKMAAPPSTSPPGPAASTRRVCFEQDGEMLAVMSREAHAGRQRRIRDRFGAFRV
ncbi:unnamed protein product [Durusdinium trenchii]|uniref:Uncharacterized protein n=1 Tax=Durusdinium trenchii TaxID=1381693 RepID=A0ABP0L9T7_9DINO